MCGGAPKTKDETMVSTSARSDNSNSPGQLEEGRPVGEGVEGERYGSLDQADEAEDYAGMQRQCASLPFPCFAPLLFHHNAFLWTYSSILRHQHATDLACSGDGFRLPHRFGNGKTAYSRGRDYFLRGVSVSVAAGEIESSSYSNFNFSHVIKLL